jgi:hypothetical protein
MAWAICSLDSGGLHLLPASGLADGSSIGKRWPSDSALVQPPLGESLSFVLVEQAERQVLGPPVVLGRAPATLPPVAWVRPN